MNSLIDQTPIIQHHTFHPCKSAICPRWLKSVTAFAALLLTSWTLTFPEEAHAVSRVGNGGDSLAATFVDQADTVMEQLKKVWTPAQAKALGIDLKALETAIQETVVFTQDQTFSEGEEVDALNDPEKKKITLSRSRFRQVTYDLKALKLLVLHEYLGIARIPDRSYGASNALLRPLFYGGEAGESFPFDEVASRSPTNPFWGARFEAQLGVLATPFDRRVTVQGGRVLDDQAVDASKPSCTFGLTGNTFDPSDKRVVRLPVYAVQRVAQGSIRIDTGRAALVRDFICTVPEKAAGANRENQPVTVGDVLDAVSGAFDFVHQGHSRVGHCRPE